MPRYLTRGMSEHLHGHLQFPENLCAWRFVNGSCQQFQFSNYQPKSSYSYIKGGGGFFQYNVVSCSLWSVSAARSPILPRMLQLMTSTQLFQKPPESSWRPRKYLFEISVGAVYRQVIPRPSSSRLIVLCHIHAGKNNTSPGCRSNS
jgi:hypothetical protein